jgi:multiple sugar transport system substrate-binding protein
MIFRHSKYPNAAKEYMRFMMEQEQYLPWMSGSLGYWAPTLQAYAQAPLWKQDPKLAAYRDTCAAPYWNGYKGPISSASGAVSADYVVVHMFAAAASGQATPKDAMDEAVRRAQRYYKS